LVNIGFTLKKWVPAGGMQAFTNTFMRFIHEKGGEVHLGKRVRRSRVKNGRASGVELEAGEFIPARWVVSVADLRSQIADEARKMDGLYS